MSRKKPDSSLLNGTVDVDLSVLRTNRSDRQARMALWLQAFIETGDLIEANAAAGISRQTGWEYRKDATFRDLIKNIFEDVSRHTLGKQIALMNCGDPSVELRASQAVQERMDALVGHLPANAREQVNLVVIMQQLAQNPIGARILGLETIPAVVASDTGDEETRED